MNTKITLYIALIFTALLFSSHSLSRDLPPPQEGGYDCDTLIPGTPQYEEQCNTPGVATLIHTYPFSGEFYDSNGNLVNYTESIEVEEKTSFFGTNYFVRRMNTAVTITCTFDCTNPDSVTSHVNAVLPFVYRHLQQILLDELGAATPGLIETIESILQTKEDGRESVGVIRVVDKFGNLIAIVSYKAHQSIHDELNIEIENIDTAEVIEFEDGTTGYSFGQILIPSDGSIYDYITANFEYDCRIGMRITRDPETNEITRVVTTAACGYYPRP